MLLDAVIDRLDAQVPNLSRRVQGAAELAALIRDGKLPAQTPASYVLPLGFRAREADAAAGLFTQILADQVAVVLVVRVASDATGEKAFGKIDALVEQVLAALAGWEPEDNSFGVLTPTAGDLISLVAGAVMFQVTFSLQRQLRIER